jgi:hypothetical protein
LHNYQLQGFKNPRKKEKNLGNFQIGPRQSEHHGRRKDRSSLFLSLSSLLFLPFLYLFPFTHLFSLLFVFSPWPMLQSLAISSRQTILFSLRLRVARCLSLATAPQSLPPTTTNTINSTANDHSTNQLTLQERSKLMRLIQLQKRNSTSVDTSINWFQLADMHFPGRSGLELSFEYECMSRNQEAVNNSNKMDKNQSTSMAAAMDGVRTVQRPKPIRSFQRMQTHLSAVIDERLRQAMILYGSHPEREHFVPEMVGYGRTWQQCYKVIIPVLYYIALYILYFYSVLCTLLPLMNFTLSCPFHMRSYKHALLDLCLVSAVTIVITCRLSAYLVFNIQ